MLRTVYLVHDDLVRTILVAGLRYVPFLQYVVFLGAIFI